MGRPRDLPRPPAFFLDPAAAHPTLLAEEREHALRVLRLGVGDEFEALDGRGTRQRMRILSVGRTSLALEAIGEPEREPAPGTPGAGLPWIEAAVAWPKRTRVEDMLDQATQLGVAALTPLPALHRGPEPIPDPPPERWQRVLRTACKQSRRLWLPRIHSPRTPLELAPAGEGALMALLDPGGGMSLDVWLRSLPLGLEGPGTQERPLTLVIGPEGGFSPEERDTFLAAGATTVRLGPHVLRIETALAAALGLAACILERAPWPRLEGSLPPSAFV